VDTSLLESRCVAGDAQLLAELDTRLRARRDVLAFFEAKFQEQKRRHERFMDAAYNLEPNIKESPGGLARPADGAVARARGLASARRGAPSPRPASSRPPRPTTSSRASAC
jgi:[protein-PII] uridylyltransferase